MSYQGNMHVRSKGGGFDSGRGRGPGRKGLWNRTRGKMVVVKALGKDDDEVRLRGEGGGKQVVVLGLGTQGVFYR